MDNAPPPPQHGENTRAKSGGLPPGNYDIFVIPPHSSGSGFLYLPSLQPNRNSFLAGVACTIVAGVVYYALAPIVRAWATAVAASGGTGVLVLLFVVAVASWAFGRTQIENATGGAPGGGSSGSQQGQQVPPRPQPPPSPGGARPFGTDGSSFPRPGWQQQQRPNAGAGTGAASSAWEKAREETRKREEEKRKREEAEKEKARAREREIRERIAREKLAQERLQREAREKEAKEAKEKEAKEKEAKAKAESDAKSAFSKGNYKKPTAQSFKGDDEEQGSFRPGIGKHGSHSSINSEYSWAQSNSTAKTTPPPSQHGPYSNADPDKIILKAAYLFSDKAPKPIAQLVSGVGKISDGLILRLTSEGLFIDDDKRGVAQREWDVKAWTLKLVESGELKGKHLLRASIRDVDNKKVIFIIEEVEAWKVAVGLQRLRRGSQVRSLGISVISPQETKAILTSLGWQ